MLDGAAAFDLCAAACENRGKRRVGVKRCLIGGVGKVEPAPLPGRRRVALIVGERRTKVHDVTTPRDGRNNESI